MKVFYPALVTSAFFFGAIVVNLHERLYGNSLLISLLAVPSILLQVFLTQRNYEILAYILLFIPILLVIIGYSIGVKPNNNPVVETEEFKNKVPERIESQMT